MGFRYQIGKHFISRFSLKDMPQHYEHFMYNMLDTKRVSPIFKRCALRHILERQGGKIKDVLALRFKQTLEIFYCLFALLLWMLVD